jgi:hypothetical protein
VRVVRGLRQDHLLAVEARLLGVDQAVERRVLLARDALAGVEHRVEGLARMVGEARTLVQRSACSQS